MITQVVLLFLAIGLAAVAAVFLTLLCLTESKLGKVRALNQTLRIDLAQAEVERDLFADQLGRRMQLELGADFGPLSPELAALEQTWTIDQDGA